jgi:hypothetical protein
MSRNPMGLQGLLQELAFPQIWHLLLKNVSLSIYLLSDCLLVLICFYFPLQFLLRCCCSDFNCSLISSLEAWDSCLTEFWNCATLWRMAPRSVASLFTVSAIKFYVWPSTRAVNNWLMFLVSATYLPILLFTFLNRCLIDLIFLLDFLWYIEYFCTVCDFLSKV